MRHASFVAIAPAGGAVAGCTGRLFSIDNMPVIARFLNLLAMFLNTVTLAPLFTQLMAHIFTCLSHFVAALR